MNDVNKFAFVSFFRIIILCILCLNTRMLTAQDFEHFHPTLCSGKVPEDFKQFASEKHKRQLEEIRQSQEKSRKRRRQEQEFSLNSNFQMNDLLFSGRVLFGDVMTSYVNEVAQVLLKDKPELQNKLRFYVIKSDAVNAFATQQGMIFINTGLLAQVNNEAELAFILSHEIGHFVKNHGLEGYIEKQKIKSGKGNYRNMSLDKRVEEYYRYSKENEEDADNWGYSLYKDSKYTTSALEGVFDVLLYSYLPFDEIEFKYDWIENNSFKIPKKYKLEASKISSITAREEKDDSYSTHPNIQKRKANIQNKVKDNPSKAGELYIIGKERFELVRKTARYEVCLLYLSSGKYAKALYSGWLLGQVYPERLFSKKIILMALYGLYNTTGSDESFSDKNNGDEEEETSSKSWKSIEGNSQPVYHMLAKMPAKEQAVITAALAWKLREEYPNDVFIQKLSNDIIIKIVKEEELGFSNFELEQDAMKEKEKAQEDESSSKEETKTEKIKKKKKKQESVSIEKNYWRLAFFGLKPETINDIKKTFSAVNENKPEPKGEDQVKSEEMKEKRAREFGVALGIEKVIMFNPVYEYLRKSESKISEDLMASELGSIKAEEYIKKNSELCGLNVNIMDIKGSDEEILKSININSQLYSFLSEKLMYEDSALLFYSQYADEIIQETGAEHLGLIYIRNLPNIKNDNRTKVKALALGGSLVCSPLCFGYYLYSLGWGGKGMSEYTFALINLKKNQIEYFDYQSMKTKMNSELLRQIIYQTLAGIKRKS